MLHMPTSMLFGGELFIAPPGQALFEGTTSWVVPAGVYSISAVAIGAGGRAFYDGTRAYAGVGGGLAYVNNIAVTPGETLDVTVSSDSGGVSRIARGSTVLCEATAGFMASRGTPTVGTGFSGGPGDYVTNSSNYAYGAGAATWVSDGPFAGYGTGGFIGGQGTSPLGSSAPLNFAGFGNGRAYGGGNAIRGNGVTDNYQPGGGCVRLIWGPGRIFPDTNTGDV